MNENYEKFIKKKKNIKKIREIVFEMTRKVLHFKTGYSTV